MSLFGTVLGYIDGVAVYSNDYSTREKTKKQQKQKSPYGIPYECVELARRWLVQAKGYTFESVPRAYDMWDLTYATSVHDGSRRNFVSVPQSSPYWPQKGCFLIWNDEGLYKGTGHVAIVSSVSDTDIQFVEQNVDDTVWTRSYSRSLSVSISDKKYTIHDPKGSIRGWMFFDHNRPL